MSRLSKGRRLARRQDGFRCSLTQMGIGQRGRVSDLSTSDRRKIKKFMAMGILPGMPIELIQKYPSYLFQVGYTQVTMDDKTARDIEVVLD